MKEEAKKEEKPAEWTQTSVGGVICGVLLLGVLAALLIVYPPEDSAPDEHK